MTQKTKAVHQYTAYCQDYSSTFWCVFFTDKLLKKLGLRPDILGDHGRTKLGIRPLSSYGDTRNSALLIHYIGLQNEQVWKRIWKGKKILVYHSLPHPDLLNYSRASYQNSLDALRQVTEDPKKFDAAIGVSALNCQDLKGMGYKNVHAVPLCVDVKLMLDRKWDESYRRRLAGSSNVMFAGRFTPYKGQLGLLEAFVHMLKTHPLPHKLRLHLPGWVNDFAYYRTIKKLIKSSGLGKIAKMGLATDEQLISLYRSADVYVSLSEHEGVGMPLIEAALYGVPVVGKAVDAVPETMGIGGLLTKTAEPAQVADIIDLVLNQPQLRRRILAAQKKNLRRFREEKSLLGLEKALNSIGIKTPKPAPRTSPRRPNRPTINFFGSPISPLIDGMVRGNFIRHGQEPEPPDVTLNLEDHIKAPLRGTAKVLYNGANYADNADKLLLDTQFDLVAQPTDAAAAVLRANGVRAPVIRVGFGVKKLYPAGNKRLLHVTSDPKSSGLDTLLKARKLLPADFSLVVRTDARCLKQVERLCGRGVEVTTTSPPPCHVLVMPKRHDGFDLAIANAMHSNMSVVSNNWGATGELCTYDTCYLVGYALRWGDNGELSAESRPKDLAQAIIAATSSEKLAAAKQLVDSNAESWAEVAARIKAAVKTLDKMPLLRPEPDLGWVFCGDNNTQAMAIQRRLPPSRRRQKTFKPTPNLMAMLEKHKIKTLLLHYDPLKFAEAKFLRLLKSLKGIKVHLLLYGSTTHPEVVRVYHIATARNTLDSHVLLPPQNPRIAAAKLLNVVDGDAMNEVFAKK